MGDKRVLKEKEYVVEISKIAIIVFVLVLLMSVGLVIGTDNSTIELTIDNNIAYVFGEAVSLDAPPVIINNRTMVPIRFISEAFGFSIDWDGKTKTVSIKKVADYPKLYTDENLIKPLINLINDAEDRIYIQQYDIVLSKNNKLLDAIVEASENGVSVKINAGHVCGIVKGILDDANIFYKEMGLFYNRRTTIIDDEFVIIGSHVFTEESLSERTESTIILRDKALAHAIKNEFTE